VVAASLPLARVKGVLGSLMRLGHAASKDGKSFEIRQVA
jgi:hypothetical protein